MTAGPHRSLLFHQLTNTSLIALATNTVLGIQIRSDRICMILPDLDDPHQEPGDPDPNLNPDPDLFDIKYLYIFCKYILKA
jgi:hypothetical protein